MTPRKVDVVALLVGLGAMLVGGTVLWISFGGTATPSFVKVAVPLSLVTIGGLGILASRH